MDNQYLVVQGPRVTWYRPTNLSELLELKAKYHAAKIVNGNTEIGKSLVDLKIQIFT